MNPPDPRRRRLALVLAVCVAAIVFVLRMTALNATSDFYWPHCAARELLQGRDPYGQACFAYRPDGQLWTLNPLTTVLAVAPLAPLPLMTATALILGGSAGLLAYGLVLRGGPWMLSVFLSLPAYATVTVGQWSFLLPAIALLPALYPLAAVKPHTALPVLLTRMSARRLLALAGFGLASLLVMPDWPWRWLGLTSSYDGAIPLLGLSGLIFLPLLPFWRDANVRFLLLAAAVPQRPLYDPMLIVPALGAPWAAALWSVSTWGLGALGVQLDLDLVSFFNLFAYLPAVVVVAIQARRRRAIAAAAVPPAAEPARG